MYLYALFVSSFLVAVNNVTSKYDFVVINERKNDALLDISVRHQNHHTNNIVQTSINSNVLGVFLFILQTKYVVISLLFSFSEMAFVEGQTSSNNNYSRNGHFN